MFCDVDDMFCKHGRRCTEEQSKEIQNCPLGYRHEIFGYTELNRS